jgi:hypothetical protein
MTDTPKSNDDLIAEAEAAAAREAAAIGGPDPYAEKHVDPAERALREGGEGEQEGFEEAEELLQENAEHGLHTANLDGFEGEVESDRSGAEYGEADEIPKE